MVVTQRDFLALDQIGEELLDFIEDRLLEAICVVEDCNDDDAAQQKAGEIIVALRQSKYFSSDLRYKLQGLLENLL